MKVRLLVGVLTVAAGGVIATFVVPYLLASKASARTGMHVSIGSVRPSLSGFTLRDVTLDGKVGGLRIKMDAVRLGVDGSVLWDGASAVQQVEVDHVYARVQAGRPGLSRSLASVFRAFRDVPKGSVSGTQRTYRVKSACIEMDDSQGPLVRIEDGDVVREHGAVQIRFRTFNLGGKPFFRSLEADLEKSNGAWRAKRVDVAGATVFHGSSLLPHALNERLQRVASMLPRREQSQPKNNDGVHSESLLNRLVVGGVVRFSHVTIVDPAASLSTIATLHGELERVSEDAFHTRGAAYATQKGKLEWDLNLNPTRLETVGVIRANALPFATLAPFLPEFPWYQSSKALVDAHVQIKADSATHFAVNGTLSLKDFAVFSSKIAPYPVQNLSISMDGRGSWLPLRRRIELDSLRVQLQQASMNLAGAVEWTPDHYLINLLASLPPTQCNTVVHAIPADLMGEISNFSFYGNLAAFIDLKLDSRQLDATKLRIEVADGCRFALVPELADLRRVQGPFSHQVMEPDGSMFEMETGPGSLNWVTIEDVSPYFLHAVLAHEDAGFLKHHGFAVWAIRDALVRNLKEKRYVQGASTITMQLAKNLFLHREKTLARKIQEVILTWWLESALDKARLLELYVNLIEYGPQIYGIKNASHHYFGREPRELSPAESAFLASVLPNPKRYYEHYERGSLSASMSSRLKHFLVHLAQKGRIDAVALAYGTEELATFRFHRESDAVAVPRTLLGSATPIFEPAPVLPEDETEFSP